MNRLNHPFVCDLIKRDIERFPAAHDRWMQSAKKRGFHVFTGPFPGDHVAMMADRTMGEWTESSDNGWLARF